MAKAVLPLSIGGLEVSLLDPVRPAAREDIGCSGVPGAVVVLVAVHSRGGAVFLICSHHHGVSGHGHCNAEIVAICGVGSLEIRLLAPSSPRTHENRGAL